MKIAVLVIGEHYAGKSKTLKDYVKPMLGISKHAHKFSYRRYNGYIKTQTLQETNQGVDELDQYKGYDILVLPSRPEEVGPPNHPTLTRIRDKLKDLGFMVREVIMLKREVTMLKDKENAYLESKGKEIVNIIRLHC